MTDFELLTKDKDFSWEELQQVQYGLNDHMPVEQIAIYANQEFNWMQMKQVRLGLRNNLSAEEVSIYANPLFNDSQMNMIRTQLEEGLPVKQVKLFAKPEFCCEQITEIIKCIVNDFTEEQINICINQEHPFDADQMAEIRLGFEHKLSLDQIRIYSDKRFDDNQMYEIRVGLENKLTKEQILIYAVPQFNWRQMEQIRAGFEHGLSEEQVSVYADPKLKRYQMGEIRLGFEYGLSMKQVLLYTDPSNDSDEMAVYRLQIIENIKNGIDSDVYFTELKKYEEMGLASDFAKNLAGAAGKGLSNKKLDYVLRSGLTENQIKFILHNATNNINKKITDEKTDVGSKKQEKEDITR